MPAQVHLGLALAFANQANALGIDGDGVVISVNGDPPLEFLVEIGCHVPVAPLHERLRSPVILRASDASTTFLLRRPTTLYAKGCARHGDNAGYTRSFRCTPPPLRGPRTLRMSPRASTEGCGSRPRAAWRSSIRATCCATHCRRRCTSSRSSPTASPTQ